MAQMAGNEEQQELHRTTSSSILDQQLLTPQVAVLAVLCPSVTALRGPSRTPRRFSICVSKTICQLLRRNLRARDGGLPGSGAAGRGHRPRRRRAARLLRPPPPLGCTLSKKVKNIIIMYLSLFFQVSDLSITMFTGATVWALLLFIWRYPQYYYKWKSASLYNVLIIPPFTCWG